MTGDATVDDLAPTHESVIIHFQLSDDPAHHPHEFDALFELEDRLSAILARSSAGKVDGIERGMGTFTVYLSGANADAMLALTLPAIRTLPPRPGSTATKRYLDGRTAVIRIDF